MISGVIHNEKQYRAWAKVSEFEFCLTIRHADAADYGMTRAELKREQDAWYIANAPEHYPCIGLSTVVSYAEQISAPAYLYREDLERFFALNGVTLKRRCFMSTNNNRVFEDIANLAKKPEKPLWNESGELLNHHTVIGRTRDAMSDPYLCRFESSHRC